MNRAEERILHGLWLNRERFSDYIANTHAEVEWLATLTLREGRSWWNGAKCESVDPTAAQRTTTFRDPTREQLTPLRYLLGNDYIRCRSDSSIDSPRLFLGVTTKGVDYARKLDTWSGRLDLRYREHKDGVVGIMVIIAVSVATAAITSRLSHTRRPMQAQQQRKAILTGAIRCDEYVCYGLLLGHLAIIDYESAGALDAATSNHCRMSGLELKRDRNKRISSTVKE